MQEELRIEQTTVTLHLAVPGVSLYFPSGFRRLRRSSPVMYRLDLKAGATARIRARGIQKRLVGRMMIIQGAP